MTPSADELKKLVAEAEAAVAAVKDPELRTAAFGKILERLLAGGETRQAKSKEKRATAVTGEPAKKRATGGPKGRIAELIADGFFKKRRTLPDVKAELANRGSHYASTDLSGPLQNLCKDRKLRRQKGSGGEKAKAIYFYSEW